MRRSEGLGSPDRPGGPARLLTTALAAGFVLGGCAEPTDEVAAAPPPTVAPVITSGPLADGFEIEPGSGLVGVVFPQRDGWEAVLRVEDDGGRVFGGYIRQAEALGQQLQAEWCCRPEGQYCSDPDDDFTDDEPRAPFRVGCAAYTAFEEGQDEPPPIVVGLRGFFGADGAGWIHLGGSRVFSETPPWPSVADGPVAPVTDVEIAPDLTPERETPVRVVEGSTLISEPIPSTCTTGGYLAVLQVTGDLLPVMRGYGEQFAADGFEPAELVGDGNELLLEGHQAGGGSLSAVGVAGDPSHVLVRRCND